MVKYGKKAQAEVHEELHKYKITPLTNVPVCSPEEQLGTILHLVENSHDAVFVFDAKQNLIGLINPYQELYKKRHPYTTKVQSIALVPEHLTTDSSVLEAFKFMLDCRIYRLPVFANHNKADRKVVGKIDVKDLLRGILSDDEFMNIVIANLQPSKVISIHQNAYVQDVYNVLRQKGISKMVLVDDEGQVSGIVSRFDIQKAFISPTPKQRFHKQSGDAGEFTFDEEKITRKDSPVARYQTYMVKTISDNKPLREALDTIINSDLDDIVIIDKAGKPKAILTTRDILHAILELQSEQLPNIIFENPKEVSQYEVNLAYEFVVKFIKKVNTRSLIDQAEIHFKEAKFSTGKVAAFDTTLRIDFMSGKTYIAKTKRKEVLVGVKEAIKELEKQLRLDRVQSDHHRKPHHAMT